VAWTGSEGRFGVLGLERGDLSGLAVIGVLQDSEVSFYIGDIDVLSIRGKEYAMSFLLSLVDCGDGFPGYPILIKGIDVQSSIPVADAQNVPVFLIKAQVARSVVEVDVLVLFVGTVFVEEDDRSRYLAGIPARGGYVEQGLAGVSGDDAAREVELHFLRDLEIEAFSLGSGLDNPESVFLRARGVDMKGLGSA